jgi:hypothetical protein
MYLIPPSKDTAWQTGLKKRSNNLLLTGDSSHRQNKHWLRMKGWKKIYQANGHQKEAGVAILITDKVDFKLTLIK